MNLNLDFSLVCPLVFYCVILIRNYLKSVIKKLEESTLKVCW